MDYKNRKMNNNPDIPKLDNKGKQVFEKDGVTPVMVPTYSKGHLNAMANRYMIKMFFKNLWVFWRQLEGLSTEPGYEESKLGKDTSKHIDPWGNGPLPQAAA